MVTPSTPAPASNGSDSSGLGGLLGGLGGSLGKLFSGRSAMGMALGVGVALLFGFDDPMWIMGLGILGAASTSGIMGDLFSGAKNLFGSLFGGKSDTNQQHQQPQQELAQGGQNQNQQQAQQQAAQFQQNGQPRQSPQNVSTTDAVSAPYTPFNYDPVNHKGVG